MAISVSFSKYVEFIGFFGEKIFRRIRTAILVLVANWRNFAPEKNSDCIAWSVVDIDGPVTRIWSENCEQKSVYKWVEKL
jgi:hypothetical protein